MYASRQSAPLFGMDLTAAVQRPGAVRRVPLVVHKCIEAVDQMGLDHEGIYRQNGALKHVKAIMHAFERGPLLWCDIGRQECSN